MGRPLNEGPFNRRPLSFNHPNAVEPEPGVLTLRASAWLVAYS